MASRFPGRLFTAQRWLRRLPFDLLRRKPARVERILVLHHLLLGDSLMAMALVAKLRQQYPAAAITVALPRAFVPLLAGHPWGIEAMPFDVRDASTLRALAALPAPDLCYLPADNRYAWLARGLGARWIVGFAGDKPAHKNWMVDELRPYSTVPTSWSDTVAELVDGPVPRPYATTDWPAPAARDFARPASPYAVLHLGASSALKLWPAERWQALAQDLARQGITPVWSAGKDETPLVEAVDPAKRWPSYAGQLDLTQLWHLLAGAKLLVCPDTGVAHLGRVVGTPTLTLFGPGSTVLCGAGEFWRAQPYRAQSIDIACRDQQTNFQRIIPWIRRCERFMGEPPMRCPQARCMDGIHQDAVIATAREMIGAP